MEICGSDLHIYEDEHPNHPPVILGHEFSGIITQVGSGIKDWKIGDRVVSELHAGACRRCLLCRTGNFFACPHKHPSWMVDQWSLRRVYGNTGGFGGGQGRLPFSWKEAIFKAVNVVFSFSANYLAFEQSLNLLASGRIPARKIISGVYPLESWFEAFQALRRRKALKIVLEI